MDATARRAGVSKGGLLYHFGSKSALEAGMIARLHGLVDEDVTRIATAEDGVEYYLRSSAMDDDALDRAIIAVSRLAQNGSEGARAALAHTRTAWAEALRPLVRDQAALDLVILLGDGLYYNNAVTTDRESGTVPRGSAMDALVALTRSATR